MKTRFPFLRLRFLGEACFTDTKEYKANGVRKFCQMFYTRESRYAAVYDVPGMKAKHLVGAYEKFFRDVGVPTVMFSDGHQSENRSKEVKVLAESIIFVFGPLRLTNSARTL